MSFLYKPMGELEKKIGGRGTLLPLPFHNLDAALDEECVGVDLVNRPMMVPQDSFGVNHPQR
ncbi:MAG: hypothetical protein OEY18_07515 [Candidatus Aminicenantes bacterium]|nr:hypothetical protein [Candidatus Aminicenantes bacterium]